MQLLVDRATSLAVFAELGADGRAVAAAARNLAIELAAMAARDNLRRVA